MAGKKQKYYVVWYGREPGIYTSWEECVKQTSGFKGAKYKAYPTPAEAEQAFIYGPEDERPADEAAKVPDVPGTKKPQEKNIPPVLPPEVSNDAVAVDAACSGNPGPGGWGAILQYGKAEKELSGSEPSTTNNRMELLGVITALETLKEPCSVDLYSDSKYVVDGITKGWAKGWRARGWVKSDKKPAKNPELWGRLLDLLDKHEVRFHWVKGHADNPYNNRCDELAVGEYQKYK